MTESELLARLSQTLRKEIGPALTDEYAKTQAFMAAVVTDKLARQLASQATHAAAAVRDMDDLLDNLNAAMRSLDNSVLADAHARLGAERDANALCAFIEALYASRERIGDDIFNRVLGRVRQSLRADIDRRVEYSA